MARYATEHDGRRVEVVTRITGKCWLRVDGREVATDSTPYLGQEVTLSDETPGSDLVVHVHFRMRGTRVTLRAGGQEFLVPRV